MKGSTAALLAMAMGLGGGSLPAPFNKLPPPHLPCPKDPEHGQTNRKYCPVCKARVRPKRNQ